jgi:hypothetical protein
MKLWFVSHASFSVESGGITLLCDPSLGVAANVGLILRCRPCTWTSHALRIPPRLASFRSQRSLPTVVVGPSLKLMANRFTLSGIHSNRKRQELGNAYYILGTRWLHRRNR